MPRYFANVLVAVLIVSPLHALLTYAPARAETTRPDPALDPFESPESFNAVIARLRVERQEAQRQSAERQEAEQQQAAAKEAAPPAAGDDASEADSNGHSEEEANDVVADSRSADEDAVAPAPPPRKLTPKMTELRDRVRATLRQQIGQDFDVRTSTVTDVIHYCLAFGRKAGVDTANQSRPVSAIGCLCYNYPFGGYRALTLVDDLPAGRIGYGQQAYPSQLLAVLAQSRVSSEYGFRVGSTKATISDLVESEKLSCRPGDDLGLKLVGLSYYVRSDTTWNSRDGESWSLDRMIQEEMDVPFLEAPCGGVNRLMGLSYAVQRRTAEDLPIDGGFQRAQRYLDAFHDHALKLQNSDGSWHPKFFRVRGLSRDTAGTLRTTGMILEWLAFSLPLERLDDERLLRSADYLNRVLNTQRYRGGAPSLPSREIAAVMHALHALNIYDERVFQPADPPPESEQMAERDEPSTAG